MKLENTSLAFLIFKSSFLDGFLSSMEFFFTKSKNYCWVFYNLGTIFKISKLLDAPVSRVATEDKYGSNVNMEPDSPTDEDKKAKQDEGKNNLPPDQITPCLNSFTYQYMVNSVHGCDQKHRA